MGQSKRKPFQTAVYCSVTAAAALSACAYGLARAFEDGGATPGEFFLALSPVAIASLGFAFLRVQGRRLGLARRDLEKELAREREVSGLRLKAVESLAIAIDAKDQTTQGHVRRTRLYATELGKLLHVTRDEMSALEAGALLHDIGKLAVPEYILNKPGKLTAAEFEKMKVHPAVGADIVGRIGFPFPVEEVVRHHHERWDGKGYPRGLRGEEIPLVARIISVVDFYDSTRCDRPYRAGMSRDESLALLRRESALSFDPLVVETFVKNVEAFDRMLSEADAREQVRAGAEASAGVKVSDESVAVRTRTPAQADNASGFRSIADAQREVSALQEMAQAIGSSLNLQDTSALVASRLASIVPFDTCVFFVADERSGVAVPVYASGAHAEFFSSRRIPVGEGITGWVVANARTMSDAAAELDTAGVPEEIASGVRAVVSSPLVREEGAFGAVTLYSSKAGAYTREQARLLESVCLNVSGALSNAVAFERTKQSALTDTLTGLPNARALRLVLEQRLAECRRQGNEPVAVLSIDLDDFRKVNEEFGHGVGDRLLASIAEVVKGQFRLMDMVARYAGDEFVAVMPGANQEAASLVKERVRAAIETYSFPFKTGRALRVGVTIGAACHPADGDTADELLLAATRNMRRNKGARRAVSHAANVLPLDAFR
ncbi:MAG TPA: diguanylate cyclase [Pyrinomonadaceae bacterium]|jgi:diguanylate cyclase (GGDEF)-like protein/putative nucleotidyltransferase with HDIG domain|nr:diguanylate cyclase [Pyrinomonadaceae bacterium]